MADRQGCHLAGAEAPTPALDAVRCTGCGLCALACPCSAITMQDGQPLFACVACCNHHDQCPVIKIGIHPCEVACPEQAISVVFTIANLSASQGGGG